MHNLLDRLQSGYGIGLNNRLARTHLEQVFQRERQCFELELIRARLGFSCSQPVVAVARNEAHRPLEYGIRGSVGGYANHVALGP